MKKIEVVAAVIVSDKKVLATERGYGQWKDWWEFPGGKIEPGETPEEALHREIREELATEIEVVNPIGTVDYDYPDFHLTMRCYVCRLTGAGPELLEHEAAKWLSAEELESVRWLPADISILPEIKKILV